METRGEQPGFGPVYAANSRVLILGSYPSPKSFEQGFYYGHPQNRFWPLLAALAGQPVPMNIEDKKELITEKKLALWDALERCVITGAQDASITQPRPNNIAALLEKTQIERVYCNGQAAFKYYTRLCRPATGLDAVCLPSTSPANAQWGFEKLLESWRLILPC